MPPPGVIGLKVIQWQIHTAKFCFNEFKLKIEVVFKRYTIQIMFCGVIFLTTVFDGESIIIFLLDFQSSYISIDFMQG